MLTRDLAHRLQLEKREVNRLLYRLEIDGIAQRVTVKPPSWRLAGSVGVVTGFNIILHFNLLSDRRKGAGTNSK